MTIYKILSPRVGEIGSTFEPTDDVNIDALIANKFIIEDVKQAPKKSDKTEPPTSKE
jgi:hypothetical protein